MARADFNDGQEQIFEDLDKIPKGIEQELYDRLILRMLQNQKNAFLQDSFKVNFLSATQVSVLPGLGFQEDVSQIGLEPKQRPVFLAAASTQGITAPDLTNPRIDVVSVKSTRANTKSEDRNFKDEITEAVSVQSLNVETDWSNILTITAGTPNPSPSAPATPSGEIKIAEIVVTAVSGIANQAAITDFRTLMPVGQDIKLDTSTGFVRLTSGTSVALSQLIKDIEAFLVAGLQTFTDYIDVTGTPPDAPGAGRKRLFFDGDVLFFIEEGDSVFPVGGAGGGGGGANWQGDTNAPIEDIEFSEKIWLYEDGESQKLSLYIKIPQGFVEGRQIKMFIGQYSPSSSNTQLLSALTSLIRKDLDAINSTTNQHSSINTAITNTVANQYREVSLDLTDTDGLVNGVSVEPGALLKIELTRGSDTDTADIRFVPSSTEVKFG